MKPKVIKKPVPRQKHWCAQMFVNFKLICSLLMLMLHIAILRWPRMSPWCYWLEKVQRWELGSALRVLRSLLSSELISAIPSYPTAFCSNKQARLSGFQARGSSPFTIDWEEFSCVWSLHVSARPSLRVWETRPSSAALCCWGLQPLPASWASQGCREKESTQPPSRADLRAHKASLCVQSLGNYT